jgi:geranylgeranyl pyrophosphate synthase
MIDTTHQFTPKMENLQQVEALLSSQVNAAHSPFEAVLADLVLAGGKRLRPRIALLCGSALGAEPLPLIHLAAAIEMLHTATLIHDDIVDGSALRRGKETLNARWSAGACVLTGDLAFTRAARLVHNTRSFPVVEMFTRTMSVMIDSEVSQLARSQGLTRKEEYFSWIGAKTAALFELSAGAPALLSNAGEAAFSAARRFGYAVGMAFQIVDDVLDYTGDPHQMGKPAGNDLRQNVMTLPALLYLGDHPGDPDLKAVIRREPLEDTRLVELQRRISRSPAIDRALETASTFIREGLEDLACLPDCPERFALAEIALEIPERQS